MINKFNCSTAKADRVNKVSRMTFHTRWGCNQVPNMRGSENAVARRGCSPPEQIESIMTTTIGRYANSVTRRYGGVLITLMFSAMFYSTAF